jgi:hypothetical protein
MQISEDFMAYNDVSPVQLPIKSGMLPVKAASEAELNINKPSKGEPCWGTLTLDLKMNKLL